MSREFGLRDLLEELAQLRGFDFRGYKRTTLERRFRKRMFQLNLGSYADYSAYIRKTPDEVNSLLTTILINVTEFFRDPPAWEILRHELLPPILKQLKPGATFRVWSAGCASGEEAYSIAIVLAELFGNSISDYDVKIYATDIDEEELTIARRGEYSPDAVRRVRPEWREKYFQGHGTLRVARDIRRLVIFGRSNLTQDAPISHVNLLTCRNVLIYFDSELQKQILHRLHYALEPGGILFLGKSESQLTNSPQFRRLNARWRMFQRGSASTEVAPEPAPDSEGAPTPQTGSRELEKLRSEQRFLMETLRLGVIVLSENDMVNSSNVAALSLFGLPATSIAGKRIQDTDLFLRTPELGAHLQATHVNNEISRFQVRMKVGSDDRLIEVAMRPILDDNGDRTATLMYCEDITLQERLQTTVEELESTNEELQSTNEELETTNEELQSTNEELETTNEELQSLNEELETTNQELEERTKELDQLNGLYSQTLEKIRMPVMLVNQERRIAFWNTRALKLFGFKSKPPVELQLEQLPLPEHLRTLMLRRHRAVIIKGQPVVVRGQIIPGHFRSPVNIHFGPVDQDEVRGNVLITFEPVGNLAEPPKDKPRAGNGREER